MDLKSAWKLWSRSWKKTKGPNRSRRRLAAPWAAEVLEARQLLSSITVTSLLDNTTGGDGQITLREALIAANTNSSVDGSVAGESGVQDRIVFADALAGRVELDAALGTLVISDSVRIEASGATRLTIDAREQYRVFDVAASAGNVTFAGLAITGGRTTVDGLAGAGAGIRSASVGTLSLESVELTSNHTSGNAAHGAGLYAGAGNVSTVETTIAKNATSGSGTQGGGMYAALGTVTTTNSTISGNTAVNGGGLFSQAADLFISSTTIADNSATDGAGLSLFNGSLQISNSIVAGNEAGAAADDIRFTNNGGSESIAALNSLIGVNDGASLAASPGGGIPDAQGNLIGTPATPIDAMLDVLSGNGGQTRTHALLFGSPAINSGSNAQANALDLHFDQRGVGSARIDGTVDMGAFEAHAANPLLVVKTPDDELDVDLSNPDDLSLREAIAIANARFGEDTIVFDLALNKTPILMSLGELAIRDSLRMTGNGPKNTIINAQGGSRALDVLWGAADLRLNNLTVTHGRVTGTVESGAGIRFLSPGRLLLNDVEVSNSSVVGVQSRGGAIFANPGQVVVVDSLIATNNVQGDFSSAAGIFSHMGTVTVVNSTVSGNIANGASVNGSAILTDSVSSSIELVNSTVTENVNNGDMSSRGAVVAVRGSISLANSIVAGNTVTGFGEIDVTFANFDGVATFAARNSIIGVNTDTPLAGTGGAVGANGNFVGTSGAPFDPQLGQLAFSTTGEATRTHRLLAGSAAIDAGSNVLAVGPDGAPVFTDQRGGSFLRIVNGIVDIGAFERSTIEGGPRDRIIPLEGLYFDGANIAAVLRDGTDLTLRTGAGVIADGKVLDGTHIVVTGMGNLAAEFHAQAGTLVFENGTVWRRVPPVTGYWFSNLKGTLKFAQLGTNFTTTNEQGAQSDGSIQSAEQVTLGGSQGTLSRDSQLIFASPFTYELFSVVEGNYANSSGQPVRVEQSGTSLKIVNENGLATNGRMVNPSGIIVDDWGLSATVHSDGLITWSHGDRWKPQPVTGLGVELAGLYDVTGTATGTGRILQAGAAMTVVDELGVARAARFLSSTEIVVDSTNVHGIISGNAIQFTDGKIFTRIPNLDGPQIDQAGNETRIDQLERSLTFTSSAGVVTHGRITSQTQFIETDGAQRTGTISGKVLNFSDGTVWTKLPDLRGNWVNTATGNPTYVEQAGDLVRMVTDVGGTINGDFLNAGLITTDLPGNVTVSVGNDELTFSNGMVWQRHFTAIDAVFADPREWPFV